MAVLHFSYIQIFMRSSTHIITNSSIGTLLYIYTEITPILLILFVIWGGLLMDIDHIVLFMTKYKLFTLKKWIEITRTLYKKRQAELYIFHSPEFHIVLIVLSFFHELFLWILLGSAIHIMLDILSHYHYHKNFRFLLVWSLFYHITRN